MSNFTAPLPPAPPTLLDIVHEALSRHRAAVPFSVPSPRPDLPAAMSSLAELFSSIPAQLGGQATDDLPPGFQVVDTPAPAPAPAPANLASDDLPPGFEVVDAAVDLPPGFQVVGQEPQPKNFGSVARGFNQLTSAGAVALADVGVISPETAAGKVAQDQLDAAEYPMPPET